MRSVPEEVKAKLPIEEVIGAYVPLKKAGRIYKGICPFHNEKTPSFTVNPERGIFKCFGCNEGGDVIAFVQKIEGLTFPEALKLLADRAGIVMPDYKGSNEPKGPSKSRLFALNEQVATIWHRLLVAHEKAAHARDYLKRRGLNSDSIEKFNVGYAPPSRVTAEALQRANFTAEELRAAGDPTKFADRIVFPITDLTGRTVGFTGRLLEHPEDPQRPDHRSRGPKYWNTPETPLFVKSRTLFALHLAKHAIQEQQLAILAEGQMDVIMLHQHGYAHTVASSGTALTVEQLQLLRRFAPAIAFAYDADKAGIAATMRGIELALTADLVPYVVSIPNGKDPADCLANNPEAWEQAYENRRPYFLWIISRLMPEGVGALNAEAKRAAAKDLVTWLSRIQDPTEQADHFRTAAAHLQTNEDNLRELYRRLFPDKSIAKSRETAPAQIAAAPPSTNLADIALAILFTYPEIHPHFEAERAILTKQPIRAAFTSLLPLLSQPELEPALNRLSDEQRTTLNLEAETVLRREYADADTSASWALQELAIILRRLKERGLEHEKARIADAIRHAQTLGDTETIKKLLQELQNLV